MAIVNRFNPETGTFVINISGDLNSSVNTAFQRAIEQILPTMKNITVDLLSVDFMDSAGLGLLLLLRERTQANHQNLQIIGAKGTSRKP